MPMISGGYNVLAHYPDGAEKLLTLRVEPVYGQVIPHGWVVAAVTPRDEDHGGVRLQWEITVERPPLNAAV